MWVFYVGSEILYYIVYSCGSDVVPFDLVEVDSREFLV
jgi:hypothetical protein